MRHAAPHPVRPMLGRDAPRCECGRSIVHVEESVHFAPFWRHKPVGYQWGARALRAEAEVRMLRAQIAATAAERD